jgi:hypothetical protein
MQPTQSKEQTVCSRQPLSSARRIFFALKAGFCPAIVLLIIRSPLIYLSSGQMRIHNSLKGREANFPSSLRLPNLLEWSDNDKGKRIPEPAPH